MAAFTDLDDLAVNMTGGSAGAPENLMAYKNMQYTGGVLSSGSGIWKSWWAFDGIPGPGTIPGTVAAPTSATTGAIPFTNASGGREKFIAQAGGFGSVTVGLSTMVYDRLLHIGSLPYATTTAQTVGGTITRNTGGVGNEIWFECDTTIGGARDVTCTYTNQAGTGSRVTPTLEVGNGTTLPSILFRLPLQAGDTGVQSVEDVTITTGSTGTFAIVIARPLLMLGANGNPMTEPPWPKIDDDACLALASRCTTTGPFMVTLATVER